MIVFGAFYLLLGDTGLLGSGILMAFGIVYLAPLMLLYRQSVRYSISIMCSSWIYTMTVYALSIQIAGLFPQLNYRTAICVIQTVLYALTIHPFFGFVSGKFTYIIKNADHKTKNLLFFLGISWFLFFVLLNYMLVFDMPSFTANVVKILVIFSSAANALMTYQIFYSSRRESQNALESERVLRLDAPTGLKNRTALFEEAQDLIHLL